jgi:putative two-component system response regulator
MPRRRKILAVDDNRMNLAILDELLSDDFDLRCVETGGDAITVAKDWEPDAILLDVMLPDFDGLTVCTRLRNDPALRHTVIVFVTAKALDVERSAGFAAGAKAYLAKPFDGGELLAILRGHGITNPKESTAT